MIKTYNLIIRVRVITALKSIFHRTSLVEILSNKATRNTYKINRSYLISLHVCIRTKIQDLSNLTLIQVIVGITTTTLFKRTYYVKPK